MNTPSPRRLGVIGTLVWDTIHARDGRRLPVEEWGGIAYALSALSAALPEGWAITPVLRVGRDRAEEAFRFLRTIPRIDTLEQVVVVPELNNRVELRYLDGDRRTERLEGGVSPWNWFTLAPRLHGIDALYVNFISGWEMDLDTARALRAGFAGPTYCDLHSLFLGIAQDGLRVPRMLPDWQEWLRCFDAVQLNEDEFELLGRARGDPWILAAEVVGPQLKLICVTLGARGSAFVAGPAFDADPFRWPATRTHIGTPGTTRSGRVPNLGPPVEGDPTGCGDVWGATFLGQLLGGQSLEDGMAAAGRAAARNVAHRGARDLHLHLAGRLGDAAS